MTTVLIGCPPASSTSCTRIQARACGRSSRKRPSGDKPSPSWLNNQIHSFKRPGTQKLKVAWFREYYLIDSEKLVEADDRKANATGDLLAIGEDKRHVLFFAADADSFERPLGHPGIFASAIYQELRYDNRTSPIGRILDLAFCVKGSHVEKFRLLSQKFKTAAVNLS